MKKFIGYSILTFWAALFVLGVLYAAFVEKNQLAQVGVAMNAFALSVFFAFHLLSE